MSCAKYPRSAVISYSSRTLPAACCTLQVACLLALLRTCAALAGQEHVTEPCPQGATSQVPPQKIWGPIRSKPYDPILFRLLHGTRPPPPIASIPVCTAHACTRSLIKRPNPAIPSSIQHLRRRDASMSHAPVAQAWTARPALVHSATRLTSLAPLGLKPREQLSLAGRTLHLTLWWGLGACHTHHFARGLLCHRSKSHTCGRISRGPCACAYH